MLALQHLPLGHRVPDRLHAVSCSIPTLEDLRGYEEKRTETMARIGSGYPRFVVHPLIRQLADVLVRRHGLEGRKVWLCCSKAAARDLVSHLCSPEVSLLESDGIFGVAHPETTELSAKAKLFLQHTGRFLSSRRAEEELVRLGELPAVEAEVLYEGDAEAALWAGLSPYFSGASRRDAFFCPSGMNAVFSAFRAVEALQAARGRHLWVQLGWLYTDTISIMRKFTRLPGSHVQLRRVDDLAALEELFAREGARIAGVIAEVPSNPLVRTPDIGALRRLADTHGAMLVLDPSVASVFAVDLFPHADILVTSLTKYAAHEGDVIAGLAVVNPSRPEAHALRSAMAVFAEPCHPRDLARLAAQLPGAEAATARIEDNVRRLACFLETRPEVARVHWARSKAELTRFSKVARSPASCGGMLSFELDATKVSMSRFHDAVRLPKGPSFGMCETLLSPFIWLAHYDLVTSEAGRAELAANEIDPDLIRLAPGVEPYAVLEQALREALDLAAGGVTP